MKKNEIIELNGIEYTLELNRDTFLKIDQYSNIQKSMAIIQKNVYDYVEVINDNTDPFAETLDDETIENVMKEKLDTLHKIIERAFWLWLYPNHKLNITQIREILKPYFDDDNKFEWISEKYGEYLQKCIEIRNEYIEQKNLKALASKNK
nr:MAG TPA: hypothetical protein [Bacteriophage sp.]